MRKINVKQIKDAVKELCVSSNTVLRKDVHDALKKAFRKETDRRAKGILELLLENADLARKNGLAVCQDTGLVVVHLDVGQDVSLSGGDIKKAVNDGVLAGYGHGHFRRSSVKDPVSRPGWEASWPYARPRAMLTRGATRPMERCAKPEEKATLFARRRRSVVSLNLGGADNNTGKESKVVDLPSLCRSNHSRTVRV